MHRIERGCGFWLSLAMLVVLRTTPSSLAAGVESQLPESTLLVVATDDFKALAERWQDTSWGRFFASPAFEPLTKALSAERTASLLHLEPWLGFGWVELSRFQGPVAVAYVTAEKQGGWVLILDADENRDFAAPSRKQADECAERAAAYFTSVKAKSEQVQIGTHNAIRYVLPPAADNAARHRIVCRTEAKLLVADSVEAARIVLGFDRQTEPSLAKSELFDRVWKTTTESSNNAESNFRWFVRPLELWGAVDTTPKNRRNGDRDILAAMRKQGFKSLKAIGGTIHFTEVDEIEYFGTVLAPRPYNAAMRVFEFLPGPLSAPPAWIPDDIASYHSLNWDYRVAIGAFGLLKSEINDPKVPEAFEELLDGLKDDPDHKVDVRKELFDRFAKQQVAVSYFERTKADPKKKTKKQPDWLLTKHSNWILEPSVGKGEKLGEVMAELTRTFTRLLKHELNVSSKIADKETLWYSNDDTGILDTDSRIMGVLVGRDEIVVSTSLAEIHRLFESRDSMKQFAAASDFGRFREQSQAWGVDSACFEHFTRIDRLLKPLFVALREGDGLEDAGIVAQFLRFVVLGNSDIRASAKQVPDYGKIGIEPQPFGTVAWPKNDAGFTFRGKVHQK